MFGHQPKDENLISASQVIGRFMMRALAAACVAAGCVLPAFSAEPAAPTDPISVDVTRIGDATHLEFSGVAEWKYVLNRDASGQVTLRLGGIKADALARLRGLSDGLIKGTAINAKAIDNQAEITFKIGDKTDFFDYISDQPSRLIIDFFPKDEPKAKSNAEAAPAAKPVKALPAKLSSAKVAKLTQGDDSANDDEDADDDGTDDAPAERTASGKRKPAGDMPLVAKAELPEAPTLAEKISSGKDFSHGIFDGGDPEFRRFSIKDYEIKESAQIASRANFYLPFPMLELGLPQLKALISVPPSYEIVENGTRENKEARILLKLFSSGQRAMFLKSADEFVAERPESPYDELVRYMIADAHYDIWRASGSDQDFEMAMNQYLALSEKFPNSPMQPRTLLLMGYSYLDRGDSFGALKAFQRFTRQHPNSKQIDRVNISIAEAYLKLNRFDDAYQLLDKVEKDGTTPHGREEAAFRKGDVFFRKRDYAEALIQYKGAIARHPAAVNKFPNAWYNIAESEFNINKYRDALEAYRVFLQKFPDHDHGGYAMTRMGELLGILGADPKRTDGAFLESYFRYRSTPGAGIARIRILTSRFPEMKDKELESALQEIEAITKKYANRPKTKKELEAEAEAAKKAAQGVAKAAPKEGEHGGGEAPKEGAAKEGEHGAGEKKEVAQPESVTPAAPGELDRLIPKPDDNVTAKKPELPGIEEFSTLLIADGFSARGDYDRSAQDLITFYQKNPQSPNKDKITSRIVRSISDGVRTAVERGDFIDALRRYSKNASGWLKNTNRVDVRYNVGRAYELAGVFKEASSVYADSLKRLQDIKGTKSELEHSVFEKLPTTDALELRLAAAGAKNNDFAEAETHLKKISAKNELTEAEQIERAEVSADVAEARGQGEAARKYLAELIKAWKGDPQLTSPLHLRVARIQIKAKNFKDADDHLATILRWKKEDASRVSEDVHAKALEMRGDLFVSRGKRQDAVKTYRELLTEYEATRSLASVRYRLGQILYQDGDLKGAESEWGQLKPEKDGLWQRLASEQMQGAKWQNEYKKYLNRIPAAAEMR